MNNQALATLMNKLQAPVIVSDILTGKDNSEETRYALTSLISDMKTDEAVLAIALSMRNIVGPFLQASPSLQMTEIECKRIIEDYADAWEKSPLSEDTSPQDALDTLDQASEDLEYLEELLELNINYLQAKDIGGAELCKLLKAQTGAHRLNADTFISILDQDDINQALPIKTDTQNIIAFPNNK